MKMRSGLFHLLGVIILGVFGVILSGCGTSPATRFYLLSSIEVPDSERKPLTDEPCFSIGIGPINIPDYLDQSRIVIREAPNEVTLGEFDHWAEHLNDNFTRVLAKNLSILLCTKTVVVFPWRGVVPIDYRIEMDLLRLDGNLGGNVSLEAWWIVFRGDGKKMLLAKKSILKEAVGGSDYKSLVSAESRALGQLSREIAEAIKTLPKEN